MADISLDRIALMLTSERNTAEEQGDAARRLCSSAQRALNRILAKDPDAELERDVFVRAAAASVLPPLQILGVVPYTAVARRAHPSVSAVVHGSHSAVLEHAKRTEARIESCRSCWNWCETYNRAGRGSRISADCGSRIAASRHHLVGEALCIVCQAWSDERRSRSKIPAGSRCGQFPHGPQLHRDLGEKVCDRCRRRPPAPPSAVVHATAPDDRPDPV